MGEGVAAGGAHRQWEAAVRARGGGVSAPGQHRSVGRIHRVGIEERESELNHTSDPMARREGEGGMGGAIGGSRAGVCVEKGVEKYVCSTKYALPGVDAERRAGVEAGASWGTGLLRSYNRVQREIVAGAVSKSVWRGLASEGMDGADELRVVSH